MKPSSQPRTSSNFYGNIYSIALPLIFSACLGNILEVVDLTISSQVDFEILKAISFLERFRFFFGAILIGFTGTLSMYLNRLLPKNDIMRTARIYRAITAITFLLGAFFAVAFGVGTHFFTEPGTPMHIYGLGTAINILIMYLSTPLYILLIAKKQTKNILKVGVVTTLFNMVASWVLAHDLGLGTFGIIAPTVVANVFSYAMFFREVTKTDLFKIIPDNIFSEISEILRYVKNNLIGSVSICISELVLVAVALKLGDIGVLYGVFFAFEKLFNAITHAVSNAGAIIFAEQLHSENQEVSLRPFIWLSVVNALSVLALAVVILQFYDRFFGLNPYLLLILGIVLFNSIDYFFRKVVLRPAGDVEWTKKVNFYLIAMGNFAIATVVFFLKGNPGAINMLFWLLLMQAIVSVGLVGVRVYSRKWFNEI
ncbi:MAG: hypothetical protein KDD59_01385 [Bdellovibrionales bacterium]|nr:hypothetical protein [Bdellovibrionales bacterium]